MRYYSTFGSDPELNCSLIMAGPQDENQLPPEVVSIFQKQPHTSAIAVMFNHGIGERIEIFRRIPDERKDAG